MSRSEYRYREHAYTCALSIHVGMKWSNVHLLLYNSECFSFCFIFGCDALHTAHVKAFTQKSPRAPRAAQPLTYRASLHNPLVRVARRLALSLSHASQASVCRAADHNREVCVREILEHTPHPPRSSPQLTTGDAYRLRL